ncbi:LysM peptidoglycan-binding domain-containing protein [Planotetraspora silvatica]|uniref:LysM peptidoglycan-binding domain-containing protein n=1 Tax=Planotetraspora silvatica TaxID=234614 RepID=UPI00195224CC|nr:LysM peptidoglycan-binding domain-containing protein [Planotetraspora silvatica]
MIDIGAGALGGRPRVDGTAARAARVPGPADGVRATPAPGGASRPGAHSRAVSRVAGPASASRPGARPRAVVRRPDPPLRLTRRGKVVLVTVVTILALGVLWLGTLAAVTASTGTASPAHDGLPYVDVQRGDTLWKIASAVGDGGDPAPMVRQIMNLNGLSDSLIRPGTRLYVPSGLPR